jgi:hypothetical protein
MKIYRVTIDKNKDGFHTNLFNLKSEFDTKIIGELFGDIVKVQKDIVVNAGIKKEHLTIVIVNKSTNEKYYLSSWFTDLDTRKLLNLLLSIVRQKIIPFKMRLIIERDACSINEDSPVDEEHIIFRLEKEIKRIHRYLDNMPQYKIANGIKDYSVRDDFWEDVFYEICIYWDELEKEGYFNEE